MGVWRASVFQAGSLLVCAIGMSLACNLPILDRRPSSSALRLKNPPWARRFVGNILGVGEGEMRSRARELEMPPAGIRGGVN